MKGQAPLFDEEPRYCMDTNVVLSFMLGTDDEAYGADVFAPQWQFVERLVNSGAIVSPYQVELELEKWFPATPALGVWVRKHKHMFLPMDSSQLTEAKRIVNVYEAYGRDRNYLGDLSVMALASSLGIAVLTLEGRKVNAGKRNPKIPNVCQEFGIGCVSVSGFLRREGFGSFREGS